MTKLKKCNKCGEEKPANKSFFYGHKHQKDGLAAQCKACTYTPSTKSQGRNKQGQRYGMLLVLHETEQRTLKRQLVYWKCLCDCNRVVNISTSKLLDGTKDCGCQRLHTNNALRKAILDEYIAGKTTKELAEKYSRNQQTICNYTRQVRDKRNQEENKNYIKRLYLLNRAQSGWIAGIFDGEGYFSITKNTKTSGLQPCVGVNSTDAFMVPTLAKFLEGNVSRQKRDKRHKDINTWTLSKISYILALCKYILPYLVVKKAQCQCLIEFCSSRIEHIHAPFTQREKELRVVLRKLNKRGK